MLGDEKDKIKVEKLRGRTESSVNPAFLLVVQVSNQENEGASEQQASERLLSFPRYEQTRTQKRDDSTLNVGYVLVVECRVFRHLLHHPAHALRT